MSNNNQKPKPNQPKPIETAVDQTTTVSDDLETSVKEPVLNQDQTNLPEGESTPEENPIKETSDEQTSDESTPEENLSEESTDDEMVHLDDVGFTGGYEDNPEYEGKVLRCAFTFHPENSEGEDIEVPKGGTVPKGFRVPELFLEDSK